MRPPTLKARALSSHLSATFTRTSSNFWTSSSFADLSLFPSLICDFCPSDQEFAYSFHLTMDTLAVRLYTSSLPRRVRDFHPLERAHGAQTKSCRSYTDLQPSVSLNLCYTMDCFLRGFVGTKCCQTKKAFSMSAEIRILEYPLHAHFSEDDQKTPRRTSDPVFSARYKEHSLLRRRNIRLFSVHCRYNGHFSYNMPPVPEAVFFLPENTPPLRLSEQCKELH